MIDRSSRFPRFILIFTFRVKRDLKDLSVSQRHKVILCIVRDRDSTKGRMCFRNTIDNLTFNEPSFTT